MRSLKNIISRYMYIITSILVAVILVILAFVQLRTEQKQAYGTATRTIKQIAVILEENQKELVGFEEEYRQNCVHNAEIVARIIEGKPEILSDDGQLREIAQELQVDEIHIFDTAGAIFAGTHPQYFGYTFDSGEQIAFFKPMLEDKTLKLIQDITPNTADARLMQYSAIWSESGDFIVQVGMEPVNVMKVTAKNELSYIFSLFRVNAEANYYAIEKENGVIVGSTDLDTVGMHISEIGIDERKIGKDKDGFHTKVNGIASFCVFAESGENYIGRVITIKDLYERVPVMLCWLFISLVLVSGVLAHGIVRYMNRYVVVQIDDVNKKLKSIADGNLKERLDLQSSLEFQNLSQYINMMVKSLVDNNRKMSYALSKTNLHIGTYEYGGHIQSVNYTEYIPRIFSVEDKKMEWLAKNPREFEVLLAEVKTCPVANEQSTYKYGEQYIRLEEIQSGEETFGVAIDVTVEMLKRMELEKERDFDILTGLYNRRGIEDRLEQLFTNPEELGHAAIFMIDADGLKQMNDTYGHEMGDKYLKGIGQIISEVGNRNMIAARQGGDEFVLFLYGYENIKLLRDDIERLEYQQSNAFVALDKNLNVPLRFSAGYSLVNKGAGYQELLKAADQKMYQNKLERRKNRK